MLTNFYFLTINFITKCLFTYRVEFLTFVFLVVSLAFSGWATSPAPVSYFGHIRMIWVAHRLKGDQVVTLCLLLWRVNPHISLNPTESYPSHVISRLFPTSKTPYFHVFVFCFWTEFEVIWGHIICCFQLDQTRAQQNRSWIVSRPRSGFCVRATGSQQLFSTHSCTVEHTATVLQSWS